MRDTTSRPSPRPPATGRHADPRCLGIDAAPCRGVAATSLRWSRDVGPHHAPVGVTDRKADQHSRRGAGRRCFQRPEGSPPSGSSAPHICAAFRPPRYSRGRPCSSRSVCSWSGHDVTQFPSAIPGGHHPSAHSVTPPLVPNIHLTCAG